MSGYLGRLARRLTTPTPAVTPRVRSRFEPAAGEGAGAVFEERVLREPPRRRVEPAVKRDGREPLRASQDAVERRRVEPASSVVQAAGDRPTAPIETVVEPERSSDRVRGEAGNAGAGEVLVRATSSIEPRPSFADAKPAAESLVRTEAATETEPRERDVAPVAEAGVVETNVQSTTPNVEPARTQTEREIATESQTIEISIGRIEIETPQAPRTPPPSPRRGPRMSLESYLARRRGGRR